MAEEKGLRDESPQERAFTVKALLFGLLGIAIVSGLSYFNDNRLGQSPMVGNHFPIAPIFYIFCLALFWNLSWSKLAPRLALKTNEMVVALSMTLVSSWVPTSGLFRYFHRLLIMPYYYLQQKALWVKTGVLDYVPSKLLPLGDAAKEIAAKTFTGDPTVSSLYDKVYSGFALGLSQGDHAILPFPLPQQVAALVPGFDKIPVAPIGEWLAPMAYWGPMFLIFAGAILGLTLLVHKQWAHHEQLSYPLASVAGSLLKTEPGKAVSSIFSERLFWWGLCPVLGIYALNYLAARYPGCFPTIDLRWDCTSGLQEIFPVLKQSGMYDIGMGSLFFTIVGIAYFIPSEVGLSMGISSFLLAAAGAQYYMMTGMPVAGQSLDNFRAGAYIGYALILLYTGRSYYFPVALKALGLGPKNLNCDKESVLAARIFMLGFAGMVVMFTIMGLNWLVAFTFTLLLFLLFLVFTRVVCETGIPFLQASWFPGTFLCELLGPAAIGAGPLVLILYLGAILTQDPRECLMPYAATSFKVAEDSKVKKGKLLATLFVSIAVALVIGFIAGLWANYNYGAMSSDGWANDNVCKMYFDKAARQISFMEETGQLASNQAESPLQRLAHIATRGTVLSWVFSGLACVIMLSLLRFRFSKCPLHPVLFLVWGTFPIKATYASFLIGWAVKQLIVRFGGGKAYQDLKPLFIGMLMGELLAGGLSIILGLLYYFTTNLLPVAFRILPG